MTNQSETQTESLLNRLAAGDRSAANELLQCHRPRLRKMVCVRMDCRINPRVDPSDVVQEALLEASRKLDAYVHDRPVSFYPWLREIAWQRLVKIHRTHIGTELRSVNREAHDRVPLPDESEMLLVDRFTSAAESPSQRLMRQELKHSVRTALAEMKPRDREVLVMKYLEELSTGEIAEAMCISIAAVKMRHARALQRLQQILGDVSNE